MKLLLKDFAVLSAAVMFSTWMVSCSSKSLVSTDNSMSGGFGSTSPMDMTSMNNMLMNDNNNDMDAQIENMGDSIGQILLGGESAGSMLSAPQPK